MEKLTALITVAFGLVAALAWNSAIQKIFQQYFGTADQVSAMVGYAVLVTIIAVLATVWIGRLAGSLQE
ncbi:MAG: DUF5654 family protein [Methanomicrobiales archaeon]